MNLLHATFAHVAAVASTRGRPLLWVWTILWIHPLTGSAQVPDAPPILQVGDLIQIQVWRQPELSGEFEITGAGIAHPLYGGIEVAGRELSAVEQDLRRFLVRFVEQPSLVVEARFRVLVGGEVRAPDLYELTPETTVARAVARAGGPTPRGRLDRVTLRRDGTRFVVDLTDPGDPRRNPQVRSGDEIVVERRADFFREILAPGASVVAAVATVVRLLDR